MQQRLYFSGTKDGYKGHNKKERAILNFASEYIPEKDAEYLKTRDYSIEYIDYDWQLNEQ